MIQGIQYLRAIAIILVLVVHSYNFILSKLQYTMEYSNFEFYTYIKQFVSIGDIGVDIFFIVSGFIILYITKNSQDIKSFILNRILRIIPLYWLYTTLLLLTYFIMNSQPDYNHLLLSLLFIPTFNDNSYLPFLGPGWTLSFEIFFYIIFSIILKYFNKNSHRVIGTFFMFLIMIVFTDFKIGTIGYFFTNPLLIEFCFGMFIAYLYMKNETIFNFKIINVVLIIIVALTMSIISLIFHSEQLGYFRFIYFGIPAVLLFLGLIKIKIKIRILNIVGDMSYTLYLAHYAFLLQVYWKIIVFFKLTSSSPFSTLAKFS